MVDLNNGSQSQLKHVVLAISTYKSDHAVIAILRELFESGPPPFHSIVIVDSLGSGNIPRHARDHHWDVVYENAVTNLGSAGNLALRLEMAAGTTADWCYCVNHDGCVNVQTVDALVQAVSGLTNVGAVYPMLRYTSRNNVLDSPRTSLMPFARTQLSPPTSSRLDVAWSSSNGALYALAPVRQGITVFGDLWMGWEDLGYGATLKRNGWSQVLVRDALIDDNYEYRELSIMGLKLYVAEKPTFYEYYNIRNLILIGARLKLGASYWFTIIGKFIREQAIILLARKDKARRIVLSWRGTWDGLRKIAGKGPVPKEGA